ncbi:ABC transporter substrate-binding protein [Frankia sp. AgB1.9]|uniref:ABC transporter substrate-binding protein n=1 Tax=unclassified Frankia TaxID=2632575 RepID=UPI001931A740|nr:MULTISPECIES: ABC transporter substrate-binding protein [unclassified Frankia]MBL7489647.1 ABC transporter substrate-binding protein [Frankia sp. AgW1.1]MBL7548613.1 ABC transporter substrate-binding protein [Frankia sp. AgB1.9]MBL7621565.1 ABC transporter substrate-binding protein [Frankia sp. AgB1.8]
MTTSTAKPPAPSIEDRWLKLAPIKIGWLGMEWARFEREIRMAFDEGTERGLLDRRYEFVFEQDAGLPQGTAKGGIDAFQRLVDAGCLAVVGANYTDSALALAEHANAAHVPLVSMCGTDGFHGEYCFRLGNGDVGGDPALMVNWLKRQGHRSVAVVAPWSPISEEYVRFFRQETRRLGIRVTAVEEITNTTTVDELADAFGRLRAANADALAWLGYGGLVVSGAVRAALERADWDPPRIMTTAFMQYIWGFEQLEGWVGIDQWCPANPRMHRFHERFVTRFGEDPWMWPNAIPGLAYDMAATVVEALYRAPVLTGQGVKTGLERIRFMPAVTGGPNTHIAGGPFDHQMFKGDWLHYGRVRDGKLEYEGLFETTDDY